MDSSSLRVKLQTNAPLPEYRCWFVIQQSTGQTIHDIRKQIVKYMSIKKEPSLIKLSIDGFNLLPNAPVAGLLRDGDLIQIDEDQFVKIEKKRKSSKSLSEEDSTSKTADISEEPPRKKSKRKDKDTAKSAKQKEKAKSPTKATGSAERKAAKKAAKEKKKEARKNKEKDHSAKKSKKKDRSSKNDTAKKTTTTDAKLVTGLPFQGKSRTKKRNMRRRRVKKKIRLQIAGVGEKSGSKSKTNNTQNDAVDPHQKEFGHYKQAENAAPVTSTQQAVSADELNIPSAQLLKKNKNKKKNHMKDNKTESKRHVHFEEATSSSSDHNDTSNPYGRAFITVANIDTYNHNNREYNHQNRYPVDNMPTLFYAQQPLGTADAAAESTDAATESIDAAAENTDAAPVANEQVTEPAAVPAAEAATTPAIDYDAYPDADFNQNIPSIGDQLAVKTLELTANYTPEISDWKQVILEEKTSSTVTFKYVPGFRKESIKGGKFDINKHRKRSIDDEGIEIDAPEDDEEEEVEEEEETVATFSIHDIFAMKNMSKQHN